MRRILTTLLFVFLVVGLAHAQAPAQKAAPAKGTEPAKGTTPSPEEALKALRADMQSTRADIVAKNVSLSAEQAAKFWPAFEAYQKEQNVIMDEQLRDVMKYVDSYDTLDDATALSLMKAHLTRDAKMNALREKWLGEFQKVLPPKLAVRVMQIDRRLSLAAQVQVSSYIPLAE